MDKITFKKLQFYAYHGVFSSENELGQRFHCNVTLHLSLEKAGKQDDLEFTCNTPDVVRTITNVVKGKQFKLIEAIAETIADELLKCFPLVESLEVELIKPNPPIDVIFDGLSVTITRNRK
ncbi:dihydroneopterin aldolase [Viridibacillus arvi]|uniref:dihydroneopterin aldolase n=1 Tax=Viridibacillus arvi TaxID=263475 RepID=UPI0034CE8CC6